MVDLRAQHIQLDSSVGKAIDFGLRRWGLNLTHGKHVVNI